MEQLEELLTPQELADYLHVPLKTVYGWRHRGLGPAGFRVGRHVRFRRSDVELWITGQLEHSSHQLNAAASWG